MALIAATTLVACGASHEPVAGSVAACGSVPASSGPLASVARLAIKAPATASAGEVVRISATVTSRSAPSRVITTPGTSALLVVRDGKVVGKALGRSGPAVPLPLTPGSALPAQAVPTSIRLAGCGSGGGSASLAAGRYTLVAVLGYQLDPLNTAPEGGTAAPPTGARDFRLVSAPASITVG
jgi:uncharacterized protein (DUF58 family)